MGLEKAKTLFLKLSRKHENNKQWEIGRVLFQCLNMRDVETTEHSLLVGYYAYKIANTLGLDGDSYFLAGLLHDIGKIEMSDTILKTSKDLSLKERKILNNHVMQGVLLLCEFKFDNLIINFCSQHHEKMTGCGYPFGIDESNFTVEGRIASVADVFSALTTSRKYRDGITFSQQNALEIMLKEQEEKGLYHAGILAVLTMNIQRIKEKDYMTA
jgi:putative nucleotidyltransferase with HDIG domain